MTRRAPLAALANLVTTVSGEGNGTEPRQPYRYIFGLATAEIFSSEWVSYNTTEFLFSTVLDS